MSILVVVFNGQSVIEYDRNKRLPGHQREYLNRMDEDMAAGISLNRENITNPDIQQRAKFVAMQLVNAMMSNNDPMIAAMCAYLATRLTDLKQVKADEHGDNIVLDLIFNDSVTTESVPVMFTPTVSKPKPH